LAARFAAGFFATGFTAVDFFAAGLTAALVLGAALDLAAGLFAVTFFEAAFALPAAGVDFEAGPAGVDFFLGAAFLDVGAMFLLLVDQKSPASDQGRRGLRGTTLLASTFVDAARVAVSG
jgi:hypothetical protein